MEVGEKTRSALSKLSSDEQKIPLQGMKQFYADTTKYLAGHLPIDNKVLRDVSFLHPHLRKSDHGAQAIRRIAVMMPTISEEKVALVTDEWKVYQAGDTDSTTRRVDHYWAERNLCRVNSSIPFFRNSSKAFSLWLMGMRMYSEVCLQTRH